MAELNIPSEFRTTPAYVSALCVHCGNEVPPALQSSFCCKGCETVYGILQSRGLGEYYQLKSKVKSDAKSDPVVLSKQDYSYLDDPQFRSLYAFPHAQGWGMRFYLDGAHCAACVWLTEKVGATVPGVESARLNLGSSILSVVVSPTGRFSAIAQELSAFGYRPEPVRLEDTQQLELLQKKSDHLLLAQMGIAAFCTGNIMLLATSLYAGADGSLGLLFRWLSFALSLPVLLFSAIPFYKNAWIAFRAKQISIDVPITLGIALGGISSVYNLVTGSEFLYFDSLSGLVFLMLSSRYLLKKTQQSSAQSSKLIHFLAPSFVRKWSAAEKRFIQVPLNQVLPGDQVQVSSGEPFPVDGHIREGSTSVNFALLTGESHWVKVSPGDVVFAGTVNQESPVVVSATASGGSTRLGRILRDVGEDLSRRARIASFSDRVSKGFVTAVFLSVVVVFFVGLKTGIHEAVNLALALSIVTCPCAFAFATPLALSVSIGRCARAGVLVKGADVLERLSKVKKIFLDKTGTITHGTYQITDWKFNPSECEQTEWVSAVLALETQSRHPVAQAIVDTFSKKFPELRNPPTATQVKETLGKGISGYVNGDSWSVFSWRDVNRDSNQGQILTEVNVLKNGKKVGSISLGDQVRSSSLNAIKILKQRGFAPEILSGDSESAVREVAQQMELGDSWSAALLPEEKRARVSSVQGSLMVGDGANDANALAAASVGVAVHGGMEVSLHSADVYSRKPGLSVLPPLLVVARETMKVVYRNFAFSLVYNAVGIIGVMNGWVTPLFAAVLMPLSAITVFLSSRAGTLPLRRALREMKS